MRYSLLREMGFLDTIKEKVGGKKDSRTDIGRGGVSYSKPRNQTSLDDALASGNRQRAEASERRKGRTKEYVEKVGRGIDRFNRGVDQFNSFTAKIGGGGSGKRRAKSDEMGLGSFGFGGGGGKRAKSSGFDMGDLGFSNFGAMAGVRSGKSRAAKKKGKASGGREVPIYKGSRIVGYRRAGSGKKRQQKARSIFDI